MSNMVVRTNVLAINSHRNLGNVGTMQARASARLSSGFRINSAADDAAGLGISENMRAQIRGLDQASRNAQDGISLIQTAEGGLGTINEMVIRIRELTVQAANDINTSEGAAGVGPNESNRARIQGEINHLIDEIHRTANTLQFNGMTLLDGSLNGLAAIDQAAIDAWVVAQRDGAAITAAGNAAVAGNAAATAAQNALVAAASLIVIRDNAAAELTAAQAALAALPTAAQWGTATTGVRGQLESLQTQINAALTSAFAEFDTHSGTTTATVPQLNISAHIAAFEAAAVGPAGQTARENAITAIMNAINDFTTIGAGTPQVGNPAHPANTSVVGGVAGGTGLADAAVLGHLSTLGIDSALAAHMVGSTSETFTFLIADAAGRAQQVTLTTGAAADDITLAFAAVGASTDQVAHTGNESVFDPGSGAIVGAVGADDADVLGWLADLGVDADLAAYMVAAHGETFTFFVATGDGRAQEVTLTIGAAADDITIAFGNVAATQAFTPAGPGGPPVTNWHGIDFTDFNGSGINMTQAALPGGGAPGSMWNAFTAGLRTIATLQVQADLLAAGMEAASGTTAERVVAEGRVALATTNLASANTNLNNALGMTGGVQNTVESLQAIVAGVRNPAEEANRLAQDAATRLTQAYLDTVASYTDAAPGQTMWFQVGANTGQGITLDIPNIIQDVAQALRDAFDSPAFGQVQNEVTTGAVATGTGTSITQLLEDVDGVLAVATSARGALGALQNRLEFTIQNLDVSSENLSAANSRIRDTDMAREMMALTQANVLQQAGMSMLAQANMAPQGVLQLLG